MRSFAVRLTPRGKTPMYEQLYAYIVAEISSGALASGEKLPGKRALAAALGVSLNTVDTAYAMLIAEGYAETRPRSGCYVCRLDPAELRAIAAGGGEKGTAALPPADAEKAALTEAAGLRGQGGASAAPAFDFSTSGVDTALFPFKTWGRIQRGILADGPALLNHGGRQGDPELRAAVAQYLHEFRAVRCAPEQIVVGAGIEYLVGQLADMFRTRAVALENPGYLRTGQILRNNDVAVRLLPVDEAGLSTDALAYSDASVAYVTPSHQFPTGVTMPMGRRLALLDWARSGDRFIIEDDYDSEFRFDRRPVPALQGMDEAGRVIYLSTFSRSLAPGIRIAYMVLPPRLLPLYAEMFGSYASTVSRFEQQTIARFIGEGCFARHLARIRVAYRARRDFLLRALTQNLGRDRFTVSGEHTGLHLLLTVHGGLCEEELVRRALAKGVRVRGLSEYYMEYAQTCPPSTVVLGYATLGQQAVAEAAARLAAAWKQA